MDRGRQKLIEELLRVGRLIDPAPTAAENTLDESKDSIDKSATSVSEESATQEHIDDLPVLEDVIGRPYDNIDMFAAPIRTSSVDPDYEASPKSLPNPAPYKFQQSEKGGEITTVPESENLVSKKAPNNILPSEELARELIDLIENRVSQRTGEQLDDEMRDDLMRAVIKHIESWLGYN